MSRLAIRRPSPSKLIGLFAHPKNNQSSDEQSKDESACYTSAQEKTGIAPQAPPPAAKSAEQKAAEQKAPPEELRAEQRLVQSPTMRPGRERVQEQLPALLRGGAKQRKANGGR